ncbi:MAG: HAD-IIIA family hydrolase, partial [Planctomycetes bacterium]|nr:HAD-IIIA family hydrolase [Planctomycetota bacterium]
MTKRAVFLDRDGTLIEHYEVLTDPNQLQLIPAVPTALKLLRDRGFLLVMVTNQSAVAKGLLKEKKLLEIHDTLRSMLAASGVYLDAIYYCPYHPKAKIEKYRKDSPLRKPNPGMVLQAADDLDIDLAQSWVVGDDDRDVEMGRTAGCRTIFIESYGSVGVRQGNSNPHFRAVNLQEAANLIVRYADSSDEPTADPDSSDQNEYHPPSNSNPTPESELAQLHHVPIDLPTPEQPQPTSLREVSKANDAAIPSRSADGGSTPVTQKKTTEPKPVSLRGTTEVSDAAISPAEHQPASLRGVSEANDAAIPSRSADDGSTSPIPHAATRNPQSKIQNPKSDDSPRPLR